MKQTVFLLVFFSFIFPTAGIAENRDLAWRALGHYEKNGDSLESTADGKNFFLSSIGKENSSAELAATLSAFAAPLPQDPNDHAQCRFPARLLFARSFFPDEARDFPAVSCERFEKWRDSIQAKSVWVIFASAFVNSPGSMYGHTLLRFSRGGKTEGNALLDYSLSYGADIGDSGGLSYVIKGLGGFFSGFFSTAPYYLKVQEYNHVENRDFWEYELNLNEQEIALLVAHAWELKNATFPYYFFKRNCSYYLLRYLEVARPSLRLADAFPFWTIPVDTIRVLDEHQLISQKKIRASRANTFLERRSYLSDAEILFAENFADNAAAILPDGMEKKRQALVLDAAYELFRYRSNAINVLTPEQQEREKNILRARAAVDIPQQTPDFSGTPAPEDGHQTTRFGVFGGRAKNSAFGDLRYRAALHDLLSSPAGFEAGSELSMGDLRARYREGSVFVDFFELVKIRSITPFDPWIHKTSWNISLGLDREKEAQCESWNCSMGFIDGGAGFALAYNPENLFFLFLNGTFNAGAALEKNWRLGVGPSAGLKLHPVSFWRVLISANYRTKVLGDEKGRKSLRFEQSVTLKKDHELRFEWEQRRSYKEFSLGHYWYY